jgi:hypothetical protein
MVGAFVWSSYPGRLCKQAFWTDVLVTAESSTAGGQCLERVAQSLLAASHATNPHYNWPPRAPLAVRAKSVQTWHASQKLFLATWPSKTRRQGDTQTMQHTRLRACSRAPFSCLSLAMGNCRQAWGCPRALGFVSSRFNMSLYHSRPVTSHLVLGRRRSPPRGQE